MEDRLFVLAEVAVGLAGFSSVVVAFRRRGSDGSWKPEDAFRFRLMLESGLFAGFFALLPSSIAGLGVSDARLWPALSLVLFLYLAADLTHSWIRTRGLPPAALHRVFVSLTVAGSFMAMVVQVLNIADWLVARGPGPYVFGVTWLTTYSGLTFYRLATAPVTVSEGSDS